MRGLIDRFDIQSLDSKMWRARQFFDYFVDDMEKQTISMENLWLELKAGGIGPKHETQVKFGHLQKVCFNKLFSNSMFYVNLYWKIL